MNQGAGAMAQEVKALAVKSGDLSSIPGDPHSRKRELTPRGCPLTSRCTAWGEHLKWAVLS